MERKIDVLRRYMDEGDNRRALSLASTFPHLGCDAAAIRRAHEAFCWPDFYRQLGQDPEKLIEAGVNALRQRYAGDGP